MIKQLITTVLLANGINNTLVPNSGRDTKNLVNSGYTLQSITYDNNNNPTTATYYQVKKAQGLLNLTYATADIKGYNYLYVDYVNNTYNMKTEYYARVIYNDPVNLTNFTYDNIQINYRGYYNPNINIDVYYQDYYLYAKTEDNNNLNVFFDTDNLTIPLINAARNTQMTQLNSTRPNVETEDTNTTLNITTKYKYIKFVLDWTCDEIYNEDNEIIQTQLPNMFAKIGTVYSSTTTVYTWTTNVEYKQEVIDIPGLIFTILGMPFAWISTAFDLTLFPGTAYAIDIADLFLSLIGILILIIIIRKMLK